MAFTQRPESIWKLRRRSLTLGKKTLVMGVLNVTSDSFSDGGKFLNHHAAVKQALRMIEEGANILDIGGESTRPGQDEPVSADEEQARVLPVIETVLKERPDTLISIDTYKASTAAAAVSAGAEIVNDVSGFLWDEKMAATCTKLECGIVLMHARGKPDEWKSQPSLSPEAVLPLVKTALYQRLLTATTAGISKERIVLDPGYGFGKRLDENYPLLAHQDELRELGQPLLAGLSRKSFLALKLRSLYEGKDAPMEARIHATIAATTAAILAGADIIRVHDIRPAIEAAQIADAILSAG